MNLRYSCAAIPLLLAACAVGDQRYPATWEAIPAQASADCSHLRGIYADRGETAGRSVTPPSLTRELFGEASDWKDATRVQFAQSSPETWDITVWRDGQKAFTRYLTPKESEVACKSGRLVVRGKRWVADTVSGRESIVMQFSLAGDYLVGQMNETTYGVLFMVVPVAAESNRWYRFRRIGP